MTARRERQAFTLIELLVVIAVIAVVAAILFPVFAQAREKARQAACLSNLKQIGAAMLMYTDDHDGRYPGGPNYRPRLWVPGPQGSWVKMPTDCCGDVAQGNIAFRLLPYLKNTRVFLCPSDPSGERMSNGGKLWKSEIARVSYEGHVGLSQGLSWPTFPDGKLSNLGQPLSLAAVSKPALLEIAADTFIENHARLVPDESRGNAVFGDGHARFSRFLDPWLPAKQAPWTWDLYNPALPVDVDKPCSPTCAEEAVRG